MKLEVTTVPVEELVEYAGNAKIHSYQQIDEIANSISEFGFNDPIAVWHNAGGEAEVVEGHGRLAAAKMLGMKKVPVIVLDGLTDEQRRAYALVHNKTTQDSGFDPEIILKEIDDLDGFSWESFGFDPIVVADELTATDEWRPERFDDEEADDVLTAQVVTVRLRGEDQKRRMLEHVGGVTLRRMYRVGDMV